MPSFGTLKADTLTHSTAGSLDTNYVVNGSAKAWIKFDMSSSFTTEDSFNVSSLDDDGFGDFGLNFTNSMNNANYAAPASAGEDNANVLTNFGTVTTSAMDGQTRQTQSNAAIDKANNSVCILGDLA
ncbi:MAG: hypothetical protein DWQ28_06425 [Proteobacteria bacterium]|nr:MAG: hypothetical protein DWQ28_06120 [Pseudomonadota bacterium]REJ67667.1 MAG: hypothetical protein DWQ28_06425 [Pseudomonadota bacterium]